MNAGGFFSPGQAFLYSAISGQLLKTFNNPNLSDVDQMGFSVALSGNTVVLGAWADSVGTIMAGRAMIFDAVSGSLVAAIDNPTPADSDSFGTSVATGGGLVAIGADRDDPNAGLEFGSGPHRTVRRDRFNEAFSIPTHPLGPCLGVLWLWKEQRLQQLRKMACTSSMLLLALCFEAHHEPWNKDRFLWPLP